MATAADLIIRPKDYDASLKTASFILFQGAYVRPDQYLPLVEEIQVQAKGLFNIWIGIPQFRNDEANIFSANIVVDKMLVDMKLQGMKSDFLFIGGHSLGGAVSQLYVPTSAYNVTGQILMGAFITRVWKQNYRFTYSVPTLTMGGELDGLARITRIAEASYTQCEDPYVKKNVNIRDFPVLYVPGGNHMQFASGTPPPRVKDRDLFSEISNEKAHKIIAQDTINFMCVQMVDSKACNMRQSERQSQSAIFFAPIIKALIYEGYHNFRPPCNCEPDICESTADCFGGSAVTSDISQPTMGALDGLTIHNVDGFHDVWETNPVHLAQILNNCSDPVGCTLQTTTVTQNVYHSGQDLEIWKKHFNKPQWDTGSYPISSIELRSKLSSRQNVWTRAGETDVDFDNTDGGNHLCGDINQNVISWAEANAIAPATLSRFKMYGQQFTIAPDYTPCPKLADLLPSGVPPGPCWIWEELRYKTSEDNKTVSLSSTQFATTLDIWLPMVRGFHYCKIISPARVMEWYYVDGLRQFYSTKNPPE